MWINRGNLVIIKARDIESARQAGETLSIQEVRRIALQEPKLLLKSDTVEGEAFYRLRNYPRQIVENMHNTVATIPRKIAFLLQRKPAYISPAIEAFYLRDPIALKPLRVKGNPNLIFQPDDLVNVGVRFPKAGYAQLKSQDFPVPAAWAGKLPQKIETESYSQAELGMKISCGFEMLLSDPQSRDKHAVREMKMLLEDLDTGDEILPTDEDISQWPMQVDDEKWLDISFDDLEGELGGKDKARGKKRGGFGDKTAQENLQRIVAQFEQFLNDDSAGPDGAGLFDEGSDDTDDVDSEDDFEGEGEDKEASFDEQRFADMMREMMGMPADAGASGSGRVRQGNFPAMESGRVEELDSDVEEHGEDIRPLIQQMEAELNEYGALDLDPTPRKIDASKRDLKGKGPTKSGHMHGEPDGDAETNTDVNLARNLLESFRSQGGAAGPGGNMMGLMGLKMPRDERESNDSSRATPD